MSSHHRFDVVVFLRAFHILLSPSVFITLHFLRALAKGEIAPPWNPPIQGSLDTSQFDDEFTSMPIFSPGNNAEVGLSADLFEGFTFTSRKFWGPGGNTSDND